jgi:two-component system sensor histidine kinase QseC
MKTLLRYLLHPSLVRRVTAVMLLAFAVTWMIVMAYLYWRVNTGEQNESRRVQWAGELLAIIERYDGPKEVRIAAEVTSDRINSTYRKNTGVGEFLMQVSYPDGRLLYLSPQARGTALQVGADGTGRQRLLNLNYRSFEAASTRWRLIVAYPVPELWWTVGRMGQDLTFFAAITLPFMLVPLWFAVGRGLRPLRRLSQSIARRGPDELQPLSPATRYQELLPLTDSLDRLFGQLRAKMAREHAFVADAAHELRTPMAVIAAQAHVLVRADGAQQRHDAEKKLELAIGRASHLIGQLLALAHVDSDEQRTLVLLDVAALVRNELALLAPAAMARQLELSFDAPDALLHPVEAHALRSILHNLVGNAIAYVQQGGQITVALELRAGALLLVVADNGPGIAPAQRDLVFERFYRGAQQDTRGSGLGLAIVRQACARLKGSVALAAGEHNTGCRFTVTLPA